MDNLLSPEFSAPWTFLGHEINSSLSAVIGLCDVLEETHLNEEQSNCVFSIKHSSTQLLFTLQLIKELREIEEKKTEQRSQESLQDLNQTIKDVLTGFHFFFEKKKLRLKFETVSSNLHVKLDHEKIKTVFHALLSSFGRFNFGSIISLQIAMDEKCVKIYLTDSGPHFSFRNQIFRDFLGENGESKISPTSLEIFYIHRIVNMMNGRFSYEGEEEKFSMATIVLFLKNS